MTSDDLVPSWKSAYRSAGRFCFAPVSIIQHRPRLSGDGPGSCTIYLVVSRPKKKSFLSWGSLPGWYRADIERGAVVVGAKPMRLMRALVRDYSRPGDLICDPCAGGATTLIAAAIEGRRAIGAEMDVSTYKKATARIAAGFTPVFGALV